MLVNQPGRNIKAHFSYISFFMLPESFCRFLTCHAHIKALQHPIKLRVCSAEFGIFCKNAPGKFDYVYLVICFRQSNFTLSATKLS